MNSKNNVQRQNSNQLNNIIREKNFYLKHQIYDEAEEKAKMEANRKKEEIRKKMAALE